MKILLLASGKFVEPIVAGLAAHRLGLLSIGRHQQFLINKVTSSHILSKSKNKDQLDLEWNKVQRFIDEQNFQMGLACNFGLMVPARVIRKFVKGAFVVHPSLLPAYRGAAPIQHSLINGQKLTGVSIIKMSQGRFDQGQIYLQNIVDIRQEDNYSSLSDRLSEQAGNMMHTFVNQFGNLLPIQQINTLSSKAPKLLNKHSYVDWTLQKQKIINKFRGLKGSDLVLKTNVMRGDKVHEISLLNLKASDKEQQGQSGQVIVENKQILARCKDGWLKIEQLKQSTRQHTLNALFFRDKFCKQGKTRFITCNDSS